MQETQMEKLSVANLTLPSAALDAPRVPVHVECVLKPEAAISREDIHNLRLSVGSLIVRSSAREDGATMIRNGEFTIPPEDVALSACARIRVVDVEEPSGVVAVSAELCIDCYFEDDNLPECEYVSEGDEDLPAFNAWALPSARLDGVWESLIFESRVKRHLLDYTTTAMQFSDAGVDRRLVTWNRIILLHGPPGTGKTSLCRALAHKAAIRLSDRYSNSHLLEINAHSLFSKWFSESGKLVLRLFQHVHELVEDDDAFVVLLIDEVESLTASRSARGSEPSDSLRVVNAVLTQLDSLSQHPNVLVLATSNLSDAIDGAFIDRADLKLFIGPPGLRARFEILRSCFAELVRAGIVTPPPDRRAPYIAAFAALPEPARASAAAAAAARAASSTDGAGAAATNGDDDALSLEVALLNIAVLTEGLSARSLRKLPFNAFNGLSISTSAAHFLAGMRRAAAVELSSRVARSGGV